MIKDISKTITYRRKNSYVGICSYCNEVNSFCTHDIEHGTCLCENCWFKRDIFKNDKQETIEVKEEFPIIKW